MVTVFLIVGIVFIVFIDKLIGGVMLLLAVYGSILRFLAIGTKKGGAQRKKNDS